MTYSVALITAFLTKTLYWLGSSEGYKPNGLQLGLVTLPGRDRPFFHDPLKHTRKERGVDLSQFCPSGPYTLNKHSFDVFFILSLLHFLIYP